MPKLLIAIPYRIALLTMLCLALFEFSTYIANDMVMPAMLIITRDLQASLSHVPLAMTTYLAGGASLQWLIGAISDSYGRRPVLLFGALAFILLNIATLFVSNIYQFNTLRFLQGMGLGFVTVIAYPVIHEIFDEAHAVKFTALVSNIALVSPLVGPLLGAAILAHHHWHMIFIITAIFSGFAFIGLWRFMPETLGVPHSDGSPAHQLLPIHWKTLFQSYLKLLSNFHFLRGACAAGLIVLPIVAWVGLSPLLLMETAHMTLMEYSLAQLPVFGALILGNLVLGQFTHRMPLVRLLMLSSVPVAAGLVIALLLVALGFGACGIIIGFSIYGFGMGLCYAILYRLVLNIADAGKGTTSALMGIITIALYGLGTQIITWLNAGKNHLFFTQSCLVFGVLAGIALVPFIRHEYDMNMPRNA